MPAPNRPLGIATRTRSRPLDRRDRVDFAAKGIGRQWLIRILGLFVVAHGLVTAAIWAIPAGENVPFDASHSWLLGDVREISAVFGVIVGAAFIATGVSVLGHFDWWSHSAVVTGAAGAVLIIVWFDPWLSMGLAISLAVLLTGLRSVASS